MKDKYNIEGDILEGKIAKHQKLNNIAFCEYCGLEIKRTEFDCYQGMCKECSTELTDNV